MIGLLGRTRQSVSPTLLYGFGMGLALCPREQPISRGPKTPRKQIPEEGLEPTRPCGQRILSPSRLPFRHSGSTGALSNHEPTAGRGRLPEILAGAGCRPEFRWPSPVVLAYPYGHEDHCF